MPMQVKLIRLPKVECTQIFFILTLFKKTKIKILAHFIYFFQVSYEMAILAAGSAKSLVEAVCKGKVQNGMALIR
jgi:hypothetical protein